MGEEIIYIYAFPGMGKTTLCEMYDFVDYDSWFPRFPEITNNIVLTNSIDIECDAYYLPNSYSEGFDRLSEDKKEFFSEMGDYLELEYNEILKRDNVYIKDYITIEDIRKILKNKDCNI